MSGVPQTIDSDVNSGEILNQIQKGVQIVPDVLPVIPYKLPLQRIYNGSRIQTTTANLLTMRATATGTLSDFYIWQVINPDAMSVIYNLKINGVAVWAGAARPTIAQNQSTASKTGLSTPITLGDLIELTVDQCPPTGISSPVTMIAKILVSS